MLYFLIGNIWRSYFPNKLAFQWALTMLLSYLIFLKYLYETEFLQNLVKNKNIKDAESFNFTRRYFDDVLSINNPSFDKCLSSIYPPEFKIKETTETACFASFWTYTSNLTTVDIPGLKETTLILLS